MKTLKFVIVLFIMTRTYNLLYAQDKLVFTSGKELDVKITKETSYEIYFVKSEQDSVHYKVLKSDLKQINYLSGDSIFFKRGIKTAAGESNSKPTHKKYGLPNASYHCWTFGDTVMRYKSRKGVIHSVADSGIVFAASSSGNTFRSDNRQLQYMQVSKIDKIKIRRKGSVGKGMLIGAGAGFLFGGILGLSGATDYGLFHKLEPGENALIGGTLFSIPGAIIGGIAGSWRIKIPINKNQIQYQEHKKLLASYANTKVN